MTYERDCERLGLRCVDCLPRHLWCHLCVERDEAEVMRMAQEDELL